MGFILEKLTRWSYWRPAKCRDEKKSKIAENVQGDRTNATGCESFFLSTQEVRKTKKEIDFKKDARPH